VRTLLASEFGHGFLRAIVVNERLAGGGRGDERRDGGVVERAWQPQTDFVQASDSVVSKLSRAQDYAEPRGDLNCRCRYLSA
jgi:hypothetical protein